MPSFQVTWTIDIDADGPKSAAIEARKIQLDPASIATVFVVDDGYFTEEEIDLASVPLAELLPLRIPRKRGKKRPHHHANKTEKTR